jgi:flagellar basal body-associated protein FliL
MDHVVATKKLSWVYIITACVVIICIGQAVWIFRHIQQDQAQAAAPLAAGISPTHDAAEQAATNSINPRIVAQEHLKTALQLELISTNYQHIFDSYTLAIEQDPSYAEAYTLIRGLYGSKLPKKKLGYKAQVICKYAS